MHGDVNAVKWVYLLFQFLNVDLLFEANDVNVAVSRFVSRLTAKAVAVLLPILGISWIFGVLAVNTHSLPFLYIFAVFNSLQVGSSRWDVSSPKMFAAICDKSPKVDIFLLLQGFFVFLFHCLLNSEVRRYNMLNVCFNALKSVHAANNQRL